jgi:hypothetical protein
MRVTLKIDSANDEEMKRAVLAWHFTSEFYPKPGLELDGLVVKVCGSSWNIESPPIPAKRADQIIEATISDQHLGWLKMWRDETLAEQRKAENGFNGTTELLREV